MPGANAVNNPCSNSSTGQPVSCQKLKPQTRKAASIPLLLIVKLETETF
jgi:hypothetical protein